MRMQAGAFLIELLVSLILLSYAILGIDYLQINSLKIAKKIFFRTIAHVQVQNLLEARTHNLNPAILSEWNKENAILLPNGHGELQKNNSHYTCTIYWGNSTQKNCNTVGASCLSETV